MTMRGFASVEMTECGCFGRDARRGLGFTICDLRFTICFDVACCVLWGNTGGGLQLSGAVGIIGVWFLRQ